MWLLIGAVAFILLLVVLTALYKTSARQCPHCGGLMVWNDMGYSRFDCTDCFYHEK